MGHRRIGLARVVVLLALFCSATANAATDLPHPVFWRIRHDTSTLYLFGSMHVLPPTLHWESPDILDAMRATDKFVFEAPTDEKALADQKTFILLNGALPRGQSLRGLLTPREHFIYATTLHRAGLTAETIDFYRPWLASLVLGLAYLHPDDLATLRGADDDLMNYAQTNAKPTDYFETVETQMRLLTTVDDTAQIKTLKTLIGFLPRSRALQDDLLARWTEGDSGAFSALIDRYFAGHDEARRLLIDERNRAWLPRLHAFLDSGQRVFVTVGAAHIGGPKGLIRSLCAEGYGVEQLGGSDTAPRNACPSGHEPATPASAG